MKQQEKMIRVAKGVKLQLRLDIPPKSKAMVVLVHGAAEHFGRYDYVTEQLNRFGYGVYRFDHRGHGRSEGKRADIEDFSHFVEDADKVVQLVRKEQTGKTLFMLGHSMGALIAVFYALKYGDRLDGQILSGLPAKIAGGLGNIQIPLLRIAERFFPTMEFWNLLIEKLSRDKEVAKAFRRDALNLQRTTLRYVAQVVEAVELLQDQAGRYTLPCLLIHGGADKISQVEGVRAFYQRIASTDKKLRIYPELYHEIFNEPERDRVLKDVRRWLDARV